MRSPYRRAVPSSDRSKLALIAGAAVLLIAVMAIAIFGFGGSGERSGAPIASVGPSKQWTTVSTTAPVAMLNAPREFVNVALWPFDSPEAADRWVLSQPGETWQFDAGQTALRFAGSYLGFTEMTRVVGVTDKGDHAWVQVGFLGPSNREVVAATIHLQRIGSAVTAPWEVVGTQDDALTLDTPAYGSSLAGRTVKAGGMITGVDDCITVRVLQDGQTLGQARCVMAGGAPSPWTNQVTITEPKPGVVTVVASTGGHVADVEVFAVTGLRVG